MTTRTHEPESLGIVIAHDFLSTEPLALDCGKSLPSFTLRYETYGTLNEKKNNAILIEHALSGSSHAAGYYMSGDDKPGYWDLLIGPGKAFDTNKYFIVSSNVLGSCYGSTGPMSINPETGVPYGGDFPCITVRDMVRAQRRLADFLGIERWLCIAGGSMGGMQALYWFLDYPAMCASILPFAVGPRVNAMALGFSYAARQAILRDPKWNNGHYSPGNPPSDGLAIARMIGHITYLSQDSMERKFSHRLQDENVPFPYALDGTDYAVESYLRYQGEKFVRRFDANSYLVISRAIDMFNLYDENDEHDLKKLFARYKGCKTDFLFMSYSHDWLYSPAETLLLHEAVSGAGFKSQFQTIISDIGHDAFLLIDKEPAKIIGTFLKSVSKK